jgi:hypothetical protein
MRCLSERLTDRNLTLLDLAHLDSMPRYGQRLDQGSDVQRDIIRQDVDMAGGDRSVLRQAGGPLGAAVEEDLLADVGVAGLSEAAGAAADGGPDADVLADAEAGLDVGADLVHDSGELVAHEGLAFDHLRAGLVFVQVGA